MQVLSPRFTCPFSAITCEAGNPPQPHMGAQLGWHAANGVGVAPHHTPDVQRGGCPTPPAPPRPAAHLLDGHSIWVQGRLEDLQGSILCSAPHRLQKIRPLRIRTSGLHQAWEREGPNARAGRHPRLLPPPEPQGCGARGSQRQAAASRAGTRPTTVAGCAHQSNRETGAEGKGTGSSPPTPQQKRGGAADAEHAKAHLSCPKCRTWRCTSLLHTSPAHAERGDAHLSRTCRTCQGIPLSKVAQ